MILVCIYLLKDMASLRLAIAPSRGFFTLKAVSELQKQLAVAKAENGWTAQLAAKEQELKSLRAAVIADSHSTSIRSVVGSHTFNHRKTDALKPVKNQGNPGKD
jgi:hypothetical protein